MEQLANFLATSTLNMPGDVNSSAVTLTLVSTAAPFSTTFPFRIRIDDELMKVTATPGANQWTVVRGDGGSTAAAHVNGSTVKQVLTKESLDALVSVQVSGVDTANRRILNFDGGGFTVTDNSGSSRVDIAVKSRIGEVFTKPVVGSFTFDGHSLAGTPTAVQQSDSIYMFHPGVNGDSIIELYLAAPATPYTVVAKLETIALASWGAITGALYFGDGTKLYGVGLQANNNSLTVVRWNSVTSFSLAPVTLTNGNQSRIVWFRIQDNGTNRIWSASIDGLNWIVLLTEGRTVFMGASTRVGVMLNGNTGGTNTGRVTGMIFSSWLVT
jgi:hypothetical protein